MSESQKLTTQQNQEKLQETNQNNINKQSEKQSQKEILQAQLEKQIQTIQIGDIPNQPEQQMFVQSNPDEALQFKKQANAKYSQKQFEDALKLYRNALQLLNIQNQAQKKDKSIIYSNIGLTYMKMDMPQTSIQYFKKSLKLNESYLKARTNLGQCYELQQKFQEALQQYKKVYEANPSDLFVKQKVTTLQIKVNQINQKRKEEVMSGLKNIGNSILGYFGMSLDNFKLEQGAGGGYNVSFKK